MSDDTLSQDEIDALLGSAGLSEYESETPAVDIFTLTESLRASIEPSFARLGDRLDTLLQVELGEARLLSREEFDPDGEEWILSVLRFSNALDGDLYFLFDPEWAKEVARFGSDATEEMTADQMLNALAPHLSAAAVGIAEQLSALIGDAVEVDAVRPQHLRTGPAAADPLPWNRESLVGFELTLVAGPQTIASGHLILEYDTAELLLDRLAAAAEAIDAPAAEPEFRPAHPTSPEPVVEPQESPPPASHERRPFTEAVHEEIAAASERRVKRPGPSPAYHAPVFRPLDDEDTSPGPHENLDLLLDVPLQVTVELGRTQKEIREILSLAKGQVIELDKLAGEPVDIFVNGKLIAKGEVVVMDENFGVRIISIVSRVERMQNLQ